jgi:predicted acetyltransferase
VRLIRESDRPRVEALYAEWLTGRSGFERKPRQWERRWRTADEKWVVYQPSDEDLTGYLAYRATGPTLEVRELIAADALAERGLWSFLAAQVEERAAVTFHAPVEQPLWAMLHGEPHMFEPTNRGFIVADLAALTVSFMARAVDLSAALTQRRYPASLSARLRLSVQDPVLGPQSLGLAIEAGRASVSATQAEEVACDVVTLSQLLCGALTASQARWYGQLDASDHAIELLDQAFPPGPPFIHPADWF